MFEVPLANFSEKISQKTLAQVIPYLGIGVGVLSILGSLFSLFFVTNASASSSPDTESICVTQPTGGQVVVYVSGAVKNPGIYSLESGKRIADAVAIAGGLTEDADHGSIQKQINFAEALKDSSQIYFPYKQERQTANTQQDNSTANSQSESKISINSATQTQLEGLPKVGEKTAEAIIAGRPFMNVSELVSKQIVSQNVFDEISGLIEL